jgi:transcriptional regulator with XRE-family HTH domain
MTWRLVRYDRNSGLAATRDDMNDHSQQFGALLKEWRQVKQMSQLALATEADISQRHLSFIESGRAQPSRDMVLRIAATLDLPLRARNELLGTAGFAAFFPERPLGAVELKGATQALQRMLAHHDPYPAYVLDRAWSIVMSNAAAERLIARCADASALAELGSNQPLNFIRLVFHPNGIGRRIRNFDRIASVLLTRLRREAVSDPGSPSANLLRELLPKIAKAFSAKFDDVPLTPIIPFELDIDGEVIRLFNTLTTFGTPQDVTLQELRIEMSFPLDEASDALLRKWADQR